MRCEIGANYTAFADDSIGTGLAEPYGMGIDELDQCIIETVEEKIVLLRSRRVMLSPDLALLYGVEVRELVQAVKRNPDRFPDDFMFQLEERELRLLKSHFVTSKWGGARRALPYAFTMKRGHDTCGGYERGAIKVIVAIRSHLSQLLLGDQLRPCDLDVLLSHHKGMEVQ